MFWGYPKEGCLPREEYAFIRSRKGFVRMAMKHGVPIVPVYCFGNTHAMHKAKTPWVLEALSRCALSYHFLKWGLMVWPYQQPQQPLTQTPTPEQQAPQDLPHHHLGPLGAPHPVPRAPPLRGRQAPPGAPQGQPDPTGGGRGARRVLPGAAGPV